MNIRGAITRINGDGFKGVCHHWDSYPGGLGKTLWEAYHGYFNRDLEKMLKYLIDDHPAGWSTINGADFSQPPGYENGFRTNGAHCYCHGGRHEDAQIITQENASGCGCEYVYCFSERKQMAILSSYNGDGSKMVGFFGYGNPDAKWKPIAIVNLEGEEPNWDNIEGY